MALFPNVQQKIQAEIDSVVGTQRLPTIADRANLPYVCAAIKEALRWHPMTPMGLARRTNKDDYYNGAYLSWIRIAYEANTFWCRIFHSCQHCSLTEYLVGLYHIRIRDYWPNGQAITIRAISRDNLSGIPAEEFAPERFMTGAQSTDAVDPYSYAFGFSRR